MKKILCTIALVSWCLSAIATDEPPETGKWTLEPSGSSSLSALLDAEGEIEGWMDTVRPQLVLECRNGDLAASLRFGIPAHPDRESYKQMVALRFDRERIMTETMFSSPNGQSLLFGYPFALVTKAIEHETLLIRTTHLTRSPTTATFDLAGIEAVSASLKQVCEDAFLHPEEIMIAGRAGTTNPVLVEASYVEPEYPAKARREKIEATVFLWGLARLDGTVDELRVTQCSLPGYGFEEAALEAVGRWRYEPATWSGNPVAARFWIMVPFALDEGS